MCTTSTVIDGWRDRTWPYMPQKHTEPVQPFIPAPVGPNAIPWPTIHSDPRLAQQMLEILAKLEVIDKRLGQLEQCKVTAKEKKALKAKLRRIAKRAQP